MKLNTKFIHGGQDQIDPAYGSVMSPIYQTSTFKQDSPGQHRGYDYARSGNPTRSALEQALASIENGTHGIAFGSGLAAIDAVLKLLKPGDEVISTKDLYGGTYRLFTSIFESFGIKFHFIDLDNTSKVKALINEHTKMIWVETPTNPMMSIVDLKAMAQLSKLHQLLLVVDNTFATPYLQQPLDFGADIVMHSATKYLGGHSDVVLGCLVVKNKGLANRLYFIQKASGAIAGPMDSFLVLRGLKTLHLRMQRHSENAAVIAQFLEHHAKVEQVYWPGLATHPNYEIAKEQMRNFGGMVSFTLKGNLKADAVKCLERLEIFTLAESLGGVESLAGHPATMTHAALPKKEREQIGILDSMIRLSVGVEDATDLVEDLKHALNF